MKKRFSIILAVLLCFACAASAESVWVEEEWQHVYREIDCDGLPMIIDADVLRVPEDMMVQEYHMDLLSSSYCRTKVSEIDWESLGFPTENMEWHVDFGYDGFNAQYSVYLFRNGEIFAGKRNTIYNRIAVNNREMYEQDWRDLPHVPFAAADQWAEKVAEELGLKIGRACRGKRMDAAAISDKLKNNPAYDEKEIAAAEYFDIYYPVYYNGMRLYSDECPGLPGETQLLEMPLHLKVTADGLVYMRAPHIEGTLTPKGKQKQPLTAEQAIEALASTYSDMYLPDIASMTVSEIAFEYCAMTGDRSPYKGYTLYPVWRVRSVITYQGGEQSMKYNGFHAITGKQLY